MGNGVPKGGPSFQPQREESLLSQLAGPADCQPATCTNYRPPVSITSSPLPSSSWSAALWTCSLPCIHSPSRSLSGCVPRGEGEVGKGQPSRRATWSGHLLTGVEWDGGGAGDSLDEKAARGQPLQVTPVPRPATMEHQAGLSARASGTEPTPTGRRGGRALGARPREGGARSPLARVLGSETHAQEPRAEEGGGPGRAMQPAPPPPPCVPASPGH